MPRSYVPVELNTFVAGYITEASPLTFPPNSSLDEENFILNKDGSRTRRPGMDYEDSFEVVDSGIPMPVGREPYINTFKWENVGGDASKVLSVVQVENILDFFDTAVTPLSSGNIARYTYTTPINSRMGFASVDGLLVVVSGSKDIDVFTYDNGTITKLSRRLKIRDFFGLTDVAT